MVFSSYFLKIKNSNNRGGVLFCFVLIYGVPFFESTIDSICKTNLKFKKY